MKKVVGRKQYHVWSYFNEIEGGNNKDVRNANFVTLSMQPTRMNGVIRCRYTRYDITQAACCQITCCEREWSDKTFEIDYFSQLYCTTV
jgi:hypothetical protein